MAAPSVVGLDIGTMSIRAAETSRTKDGPVIAGVGYVPMPAGVLQGGVITDEKIVTALLKELWSASRFKTKKVVIGITNPQVVVREMAVTNLPRQEMRRALSFQVRDALPLPVDKSLLDFFPLEDPGTNENVRGLLIAAPKDAVMTAVQAAERAGLHVERVDLASFALLRAASRLDENAEALVDIGARSTTVVVHTDGVPQIVRTIPRGGAEITEQVATRLDEEFAEAELIKCRIGMHSEEQPETAEIIRDAVRPLMSEISSSFAYLTSGDRHTRVARLALSGGGSRLGGLRAALAEMFDVEVVYADPIMRLRGMRRMRGSAFEHFRESSAIAIGLGLRPEKVAA
jgi:type IV pilus assembly protein PilM